MLKVLESLSLFGYLVQFEKLGFCDLLIIEDFGVLEAIVQELDGATKPDLWFINDAIATNQFESVDDPLYLQV